MRLSNITIEEVEEIYQLGGIELISRQTNSILRNFGIERQIFSPNEVEELRVAERLLSSGIAFEFDSEKSIVWNFYNLFDQVDFLQRVHGCDWYLDAMLQHLVGAKLDIVLGEGLIAHHGHSTADGPTGRKADFEINGVAVHVTTHPTEALIRKAAANLQSGLKPIIVTLAEGVEGAIFLLKGTEWLDRIDIMDAAQFLTANIYEHSLFKVGECKSTIQTILERYNQIVEECETDPVLKIRF
jgi:hypothetical protein